MSGQFEYITDPEGNTLAYPGGDKTCDVSMKLTPDESFLNSIDRVPPMDESNLNARRYFEGSFGIYEDSTALALESQSKHYTNNSDYAIV